MTFIRNFVSGGSTYQEIFTKEIQGSTETQLTHDRKNIDEVWWTAGGLILFSSNRGGATNLWAIPATGGTPMQITRGPGPDIAVRASKDGRRVLYLQQAAFGSIQIGEGDGSNSREITPADQPIQSARFSPDGKQIAYIATDPDPIKAGSSIYLMNRDGQSRRRILQMSTQCIALFWSPDGRKIAFRHRDSVVHVGVVDVESPGQMSDLGKGAVLQWLDGTSALNVVRDNTSWRVPFDGGAPTKISQDSTAVIFSPDGKSQLLIDRRNASIRITMQTSGGAARLLHEGNFSGVRWVDDSKDAVLAKNDGTLWLISRDTGKARLYAWNDRNTLGPVDVTGDRKSSLSIRSRTQSKLILIEGFL